jgi:predicted dinucleotide-binding enzyme
MFICGNDTAAKNVVTKILDQFGWETADMGSAVAAHAGRGPETIWEMSDYS